MDDYFSKPVDILGLKETLARWTAARHKSEGTLEQSCFFGWKMTSANRLRSFPIPRLVADSFVQRREARRCAFESSGCHSATRVPVLFAILLSAAYSRLAGPIARSEGSGPDATKGAQGIAGEPA
jgi:hypothetical protein